MTTGTATTTTAEIIDGIIWRALHKYHQKPNIGELEKHRRYERFKQLIDAVNLDGNEYEAAIRRLTEALRV